MMDTNWLCATSGDDTTPRRGRTPYLTTADGVRLGRGDDAGLAGDSQPQDERAVHPHQEIVVQPRLKDQRRTFW
jgi:hypothetical protein